MRRWVVAGFLLSLIWSGSALGATITIINLDGPGEGFNDPTAAAPVGGNTGATLGEQRLIAFQHAADIWAGLLSSDVEILIDANFDVLGCDASSATLGGAGATTVHRDFTGAPLPNTYYPQALANALGGVDLHGESDIFSVFNSALGTTCAFPSGWYYGLDENPPGSDIDFATVVLHEIGHGLGFQSFVDPILGGKFLGFDDDYMVHLEDHSTAASFPEMTNSERIAAQKDTNDLHWTGPAVVGAAGFLTSGRDAGSGHVEMYAPNPVELGSSVSHFSTALFPDQAMEPFYTGPLHDPGLALELLVDLGWNCGNGVIEGPEECDDQNTSSGDGCSSACRIEECNTCAGEPSSCSPQTGTACDDGEACTSNDICQSGVCVADATPLAGCLTGTVAGKGLLLLKDKANNKSDKMVWKWIKGEATTSVDLGDPTASTEYLLCMYDQTGGQDTILMSLEIPSGTDWSVKSFGFKYKDKAAASDGIKNAILKAADEGKAKIIVKGKGVRLPMPDLSALDLPLLVQLSNGTTCWESTFDTNVARNEPDFFKAKSD